MCDVLTCLSYSIERRLPYGNITFGSGTALELYPPSIHLSIHPYWFLVCVSPPSSSLFLCAFYPLSQEVCLPHTCIFGSASSIDYSRIIFRLDVCIHTLYSTTSTPAINSSNAIYTVVCRVRVLDSRNQTQWLIIQPIWSRMVGIT